LSECLCHGAINPRRAPASGDFTIRQAFPIADALSALRAREDAKKDKHARRRRTVRIVAGTVLMASLIHWLA
jgi:hypothetical protein